MKLRVEECQVVRDDQHSVLNVILITSDIAGPYELSEGANHSMFRQTTQRL